MYKCKGSLVEELKIQERDGRVSQSFLVRMLIKPLCSIRFPIVNTLWAAAENVAGPIWNVTESLKVNEMKQWFVPSFILGGRGT